MYAISVKSISCISVIERLVKLGKKEIDPETLAKLVAKNKEKRSNAVSKSGIVVKVVSSMKINLAPCCAPVYGDEVIGYVSKGAGIKVHRKDCPNVLKDKARLINVEWDANKPEIKYEANLKIYSKDRNYLLTDLVTVIAQYKANILAVNVVANREDLTASAAITIIVSDLNQLNTIIANLRKVESVISVERAIK